MCPARPTLCHWSVPTRRAGLGRTHSAPLPEAFGRARIHRHRQERLPAVPVGRQRAEACQARKASASEGKPCLGLAPERGRPLTLPYLPLSARQGLRPPAGRSPPSLPDGAEPALESPWLQHLFRTSGFTHLLTLPVRAER